MTMRKKKFMFAGIAVIFLSAIAVGVVAYLSKPTWKWGTGSAFFRFDGRAVFAQMAAEPAHSVYGSKVHVWVYRDYQFLFGLSNRREVEQTVRELNEGRIPDELRAAFQDEGFPLSEEAFIASRSVDEWLLTSDGKRFIIRNEGERLRVYAQGDISEILITGHAASKVCMRASSQLYETAIKLDTEEHDLLGAGIGRFLGVNPDELDALQEKTVVQDYKGKFLDLMFKHLLGEDTAELEEKIADLEQDPDVRRYLRPERLEDLVRSMKRLQAETGLVEVIELDHSVTKAARAEVERQIRLNQRLPSGEVFVVQLESFGKPGAVLLPFYYTTSTQANGPLTYLTVELDAQELTIPEAVLSAHLGAIVSEMMKEAERRRDFAQKRLEEAEDLKQRLELDIQAGRMSEDDLITITHTIDWETLKVIQLPEPEQMRLGDYLNKVLPGIIRSAKAQLAHAKRLLEEISKAAKPQGRLAKLNQAIIIDSFLRDWDLAFLNENQAKAFDDWRCHRRQQVWRMIDQRLKQSGVNLQVIKQENVVFHVEVREGKVLITPYFIADGAVLFIIDSRDGVVRYVNPWALRKSVVMPEEELPPEVREKLRQKATWAQARKLLAAPLLSKVVSLFQSGEEQEGKEKLAEALILDPRGTADWLIKQYRAQQVDTSATFAHAVEEYSGSDIAFFDAFQDGWRKLASHKYDEAIQAFNKAREIHSTIVDPLLGLALAYLWSGDQDEFDYWYKKARQLDPDFVQRFEQALERKELVYSAALEDLKTRIETLPLDTQRRMQVIKHILAGDDHWQKHEYIQAFWEYADALQLNTEFNEPYQRIIDVYWELGMYQRALEAAFLRLSDPVFGLELQAKPLRISCPDLRWDILSSTAHENVEELAVRREASTLTILVNGEPVLRLKSSDEKDITYLEQFFSTLPPQQISPIGNTTAERLLNTEISAFPRQRMWAERIFFSEGVGDLILKAMVYGGVAPSFLTETKVEAIAAHQSEATALLGTRIDTIWETKDIVTDINYPKDPEERAAVREAISQYYADTGRKVVSIEVSPDTETFSFYAPRTRWDVLWGRVTGRTVLPKPYTTVSLPRGLSTELVAKLVEGSFVRSLSSTVVEKLLTNRMALTKLDAWTSSGATGLCLKIGDLVLVATSKALIPLSEKVQAVLDYYDMKLKEKEYNPAIVKLDRERWQILLDELFPRLLERVEYQVTWVEDQPKIQLNLPAGEYFFLDVPVDPALRGILWLTLKGNPIVWVAESSDSLRAKQALTRAVVDLEKPITVIISCPAKLWKVKKNREVWKQKVKELEERINKLGLPIEIVDLSGKPGDVAVNEALEHLQQGEAQVLGFLHRPEENAFEVGLGGRLDKEKIKAAGPSAVEESFKAIVGCSPLLFGLNDVFVESKLTPLTLTIGEEFNLDKISILIERWAELRAQGKGKVTIQELFPEPDYPDWGKMGKAEPSTERNALG